MTQFLGQGDFDIENMDIIFDKTLQHPFAFEKQGAEVQSLVQQSTTANSKNFKQRRTALREINSSQQLSSGIPIDKGKRSSSILLPVNENFQPDINAKVDAQKNNEIQNGNILVANGNFSPLFNLHKKIHMQNDNALLTNKNNEYYFTDVQQNVQLQIISIQVDKDVPLVRNDQSNVPVPTALMSAASEDVPLNRNGQLNNQAAITNVLATGKNLPLTGTDQVNIQVPLANAPVREDLPIIVNDLVNVQVPVINVPGAQDLPIIGNDQLNVEVPVANIPAEDNLLEIDQPVPVVNVPGVQDLPIIGNDQLNVEVPVANIPAGNDLPGIGNDHPNVEVPIVNLPADNEDIQPGMNAPQENEPQLWSNHQQRGVSFITTNKKYLKILISIPYVLIKIHFFT